MKNFKNIKSPYVLVLIGPPLVGKSFFCRNFINNIDPSVKIISRDQIVLDVYGSDDYDIAFKNVDQKRVNHILENTIKEAAESKLNVIVDMTNMTSKRRKGTLSHFDDEYYKVAVIFPILEWDEFVKRNKKRQEEENKNIPEHVIKSMISSYQPISSDEGFDKVISI